MAMSSDLSFLVSGTYSGVKDLHRVSLRDHAAAISAVTYPNAVYSADGELFYNDASGQQVQVTLNGALNLSATGGITGSGYGSGGVEVNWAVADSAYKLKSGASTYAHAWLRNVYLNDGDTNFIRLIAPSISADYSVTFPTAVPASTLPVLMSNSGVLTASGTLSNLVTVTTSGAATVGTTLAVGTSATIGTTLGVTGLITATAGVTAAAGQDFTVSSTGRYNFGNVAKNIPVAAALFGDGTEWGAKGSGYATPTAANAELYLPITLNVGEKISTVVVLIKCDNTNTLTVYLRSLEGSSGTVTTHAGGVASTTGGGSNRESLLLDPASDVTITSGHVYYVEVVASASDTDLEVYGCVLNYYQD